MLKFMYRSSNVLKAYNNSFLNKTRNITYVQGQEPEPKIREYFYYINHEGMLFLDDAKMKNFTSCFKDKQFLKFFFNRLKFNDTNRYTEDFPFLSICGRERNFIRCDDLPIVFTHVLNADDEPTSDKLTYAYAGDLLCVNFEPNKIFMSSLSGRVYHPADQRYGSIGLIRSKLAIELSKYFHFENLNNLNTPTHFTWKSKKYELDPKWIHTINIKKDL